MEALPTPHRPDGSHGCENRPLRRRGERAGDLSGLASSQTGVLFAIAAEMHTLSVIRMDYVWKRSVRQHSTRGLASEPRW